MFALIIISAYLLPLLYMVTTALPAARAVDDARRAGLAGRRRRPREYEGQAYPVYAVPMPDGTTRLLILIEPGRESSVFIDPADRDPDARSSG